MKQEEKESVKEMLGKVRAEVIQATKNIVSESHPGRAGTELRSLKNEEKNAVESIYDIFRVPEGVRNYDGRYWEKPFVPETGEAEVEKEEGFDALLSSISKEDLPVDKAWKINILEIMRDRGIKEGDEIPYDERLEIVEELMKRSDIAKSTAKVRVGDTLRVFHDLGYFTRYQKGRVYNYTLEEPLDEALRAVTEQLE